MAELLLHSMAEFKPIIEIALNMKRPKTIVEIGSEYAGSSRVLLDYALKNNAHVYLIDPYPYVDLKQTLEAYEGYYTHIKLLSLQALDSLQQIDMFFIDGDHNYYTVINELQKIYAQNPLAWVFLHDVAWPCAYRDMYYNPSTIPPQFLHDYTYEDGVDNNNSLIKNGGFHGASNYAWAKQYAGDKNGVKKAIEDFLISNANYYYTQIEAVMGLGLIVPISEKDKADQLFLPYQNSLIQNMENNRIELYLKVLELQNQKKLTDDQQNNNKLFRIARKISKVIQYEPFN